MEEEGQTNKHKEQLQKSLSAIKATRPTEAASQMQIVEMKMQTPHCRSVRLDCNAMLGMAVAVAL